MSRLIPRDGENVTPVSISKTELAPINPKDPPGLLKRLWDFVRVNIGLKSLDMAERFGEAEIRNREADAASKEVDNQVKLLKAKQEYEQVQAEIRRLDERAKADAAKTKAETEALRAKTKATKNLTKVQELAIREIERRNQTPEEAMDRLKAIVDKIRDAGGDVEIPPLEI